MAQIISSRHEPPVQPAAAAALPRFRQAPHDLALEQRLLGTLLTGASTPERLGVRLLPRHFYDPLHARLFELTGALVRPGKPVALAALKEAVRDFARLDDSTSVPGYIDQLIAAATPGHDINQMAAALRDLADRRSLLLISERLADDALDNPADFPTGKLASDASTKLAEVGGLPQPNPAAAAEFGLLDVLVVLAENLKWLILLPLLAGGIGYAIGLTLPKSYTSTSLIKLEDPAAEVTLRSSVVTDKVLKQFPGHGETLDAQRLWLNDKVRVAKAKVTGAKAADSGVLTITVEDANPAIARKINNAILAAAVPLTRPDGTDQLLLEQQQKLVQDELKSVKASIGVMERELTAGRPVDPLASLYTLRLTYETQLLNLASKLEGMTEDQIVISPPTLPEEGDWGLSRVIGVLAAGATAALVALVIATIAMLRHVLAAPAAAAKFARFNARVWSRRPKRV